MQKRQGISLIVLVITIIVMTILAGAIILTLNNSGIINKATDAVEQSNLATVKELTQMAWAEAYAGGERTEEGLKAAVDKALADNKVDTSKYVVEVTTSGVNIKLKGEVKWVQQGLTVTNGIVTLEIGDDIAYDETNGGTETGLTATEWQVLGASDEGELLILSEEYITEHTLGSNSNLNESQKDWLNGARELDGLCEPYGKGKSATSTRSITIEDINKVIGYDKTTYRKGEIYEYGNEVTYSYNGTTKPAYTGTNGVTGTIKTEHDNGFHYYNGSEFITVSNLTTGTIGEAFATIKSSNFSIDVDSLNDTIHTSKAFEMFFGKWIGYQEGYIYPVAELKYYWLASPAVETSKYNVNYSFLQIDELTTSIIAALWDATGEPSTITSSVRAVVTLASDINITGSSETGWTY